MPQSKTIQEYQERMTLTLNNGFTQVTIQENDKQTTIYKLAKEQTKILLALQCKYIRQKKLENKLLKWYIQDLDITELINKARDELYNDIQQTIEYLKQMPKEKQKEKKIDTKTAIKKIKIIEQKTIGEYDKWKLNQEKEKY